MYVLLAFMAFAVALGVLGDRIDLKTVGAILTAAALAAGVYLTIPGSI